MTISECVDQGPGAHRECRGSEPPRPGTCLVELRLAAAYQQQCALQLAMREAVSKK